MVGIKVTVTGTRREGENVNSAKVVSSCDVQTMARRKKSLVLGFAYSLNPDSSPGLYNQILAQRIINDWEEPKGQVWIGVQWEIADAMEDPELSKKLKAMDGIDALKAKLELSQGRQKSMPEKIHVVPPFGPILPKTDRGEDNLNWKAFRQLLLDSLNPTGDPAVKVLAKAIAWRAQQIVSVPANVAGNVNSAAISDKEAIQAIQEVITGPEILAAYLNDIITNERGWYKSFWDGETALVELHGRQRDGFGPVGYECRELPAMPAKGEQLGKYQAERVNRLIIDAICPDRSILPAPAYLSTRGVLKHLFREMDDPRSFDHIFIYASPVHSGRCERQFLQFAHEQGWIVTSSQVTKIYYSPDNEMEACGWKWDPGTAQVWCRSKAAWEAYEANAERLR